jgi:pimeloyl-ACP methyl ester carboxylesterase
VRPWLLRGAAAVMLLGMLGSLDRRSTPRPRHQAEMLQAGDVRVRTLRAGAGDTTLILIHGFGEHLLTWRNLVDPLARSYRVVAFDLPGFGGSEKPAAAYTLPAMTARVTDFLERWTAPPRILVGHSMGGAIAAEVALRHPEMVTALVLIAPAGLDVGLAPITTHLGPEMASAIGTWEGVRAVLTPMHDPEWLAEPPGWEQYDPTFDSAFRQSTARVAEEFDFRGIGARFRDLRQPTLLIWGPDDPVVPATVGGRLDAIIPCSRLARLPRGMHRPQLETPDTVLTLIRHFLVSSGC